MYTVYIHYSFDIIILHVPNYSIDFIFCPPPLYVQNIFWPSLHWSKFFYGPSKFPPAPYPALIMTGPLFYTSCVRSVMDYAVPAFYHSLPQYLKNELIRLEKRAISIINPGMDYSATG